MTARRAAPAPGKVWADASVGWTDVSVPDLSDLLTPHAEIDGAEFALWLGQKLGYYRASVKATAAKPTAVDERDSAAAVLAAAQALQRAIGGEAMTPLCEAHVYSAARACGADWFTFRKNLQMQLQRLQLFVSVAGPALSDLSSKTGRPSAMARDVLLAAVVERLRQVMKADPARHLAQQILQRCGVPMPSSPAADKTDAIRRAVRKGGQKRA